MTRSRLIRRASWCGALVACASLGSTARAQTPTVTVSVAAGDTLRSVTPPFVVTARGFGVGNLRVRLQLDVTTNFLSPILDTTVVADSVVAIQPGSALPENARIFYRAIVTDPVSALAIASPINGPKVVPVWVTLVSPPTVIGQPVRTRTPRFVWRSPDVSPRVGPWDYTLVISNTVSRSENFVGSDTSFVPRSDLEPNAVYTWEVQARLRGTGQGSVVHSTLNFVVQDTMIAVASTDMLPPFPSPFPGIVNKSTCIWFDLKNESEVQLDVFDLRGLHVRRLLPNADLFGRLPAGPYGRGRTEFNEGCDHRVEWNGTDDRGVYVPEGVYMIRFKADGVQRIRKVLFRGPP